MSQVLTPEAYAKLSNHNLAPDNPSFLKRRYPQKSLRTLLPDRWLHSLQAEGDGSCHVMKSRFTYRSIILGYGTGTLKNSGLQPQLETHIRENCASAARLRSLMVRAYEEIGNTYQDSTWSSVLPHAFLCLASAISSVDALACVLYALISPKKLEEIQARKPNFFPDHKTFLERMEKDHNPFHAEIRRLVDSPWFTDVRDARNKIVHHGASPHAKQPPELVMSEEGVPLGTGPIEIAFMSDLGVFCDYEAGGSIKAPKKLYDLGGMIAEFIKGLEKWESDSAEGLNNLACFNAPHPNGVLHVFDVAESFPSRGEFGTMILDA